MAKANSSTAARASPPATRLRFSSRILAIDAAPRTGDVVVDLDGAFVLPGLINAHDHLELNHYGPLRVRTRYENASAWIEDLRPVLAGDPAIRKKMSYPLLAARYPHRGRYLEMD